MIANTMPVNSNWSIVSFNESLVKPVVIARLMTENDEENSAERIKDVTSSSFQLMVEESPYYDGNHGNETMGYLALEEGTVTDGGADIGQAGVAEAGDVWTRVSFADKFDAAPVVVASPMTTQDGGSGAVRIRNVDITGFDVRFEEYPSQDGEHRLEKIGWVALKPGTWTLDGKTLIAGTATSVTANYSSVTFPQTFTTTPVVLAQAQSYSEADMASHTRLANVTTTGFNVKIEEETDTPHVAETVGYVAVEPSTLRSGSAKIEETKYYPYGVVQEGGGEKYLYTGKEKDKGTGLYYYGARYYNPSVGRFTQPDTIIPDPFNPQSLNRYSYVLNNPLKYNDPSGKSPQIRAQMGNINEVMEFINSLLNREDFLNNYGPDASNTQKLEYIADFYEKEYYDKEPQGPRYLYTENGLIDLKHYFVSADATVKYEYRVALIGGTLFEFLQLKADPESAFAPDDLLSNRYGRELIGISGFIPGLGGFVLNLDGDFMGIVEEALNDLGPLDKTQYPYWALLPHIWMGDSPDKNKKFTSINFGDSSKSGSSGSSSGDSHDYNPGCSGEGEYYGGGC